MRACARGLSVGRVRVRACPCQCWRCERAASSLRGVSGRVEQGLLVCARGREPSAPGAPCSDSCFLPQCLSVLICESGPQLLPPKVTRRLPGAGPVQSVYGKGVLRIPEQFLTLLSVLLLLVAYVLPFLLLSCGNGVGRRAPAPRTQAQAPGLPAQAFRTQSRPWAPWPRAAWEPLPPGGLQRLLPTPCLPASPATPFVSRGALPGTSRSFRFPCSVMEGVRRRGTGPPCKPSGRQKRGEETGGRTPRPETPAGSQGAGGRCDGKQTPAQPSCPALRPFCPLWLSSLPVSTY